MLAHVVDLAMRELKGRREWLFEPEDGKDNVFWKSGAGDDGTDDFLGNLTRVLQSVYLFDRRPKARRLHKSVYSFLFKFLLN